MSQRVIKGVSGNIVIALGTNSAGGRLYRWEFNYTQDANDSTGFGSLWRQREYGLQSGSGRAVGYLTGGGDPNNPGLSYEQQKAIITLTADTTCNILTTAIVTSTRIVADENGNDALAFEFASDGAAVTTWG